MRLIPGPSDVLSAAAGLTQSAARTAEDVAGLMALAGRGVELMDRAEELLAAADDLVAAAETSLARADAVLDRAQAQLDRSDEVLDGAQERLARTDGLLDPLGPLVADAAPKLEAVSRSVDPAQVQAAMRLLDQLPELVRRLEVDVLPTLAGMGSVGPDVTRILDSVTDLSHAILGLPGMGRLQHRGERREEG